MLHTVTEAELEKTITESKTNMVCLFFMSMHEYMNFRIIPIVEQLSTEYRERITFLGIDTEKSGSYLSEFLERHRLSLFAVPSLQLIDKSFTLLSSTRDFLNIKETLEEALTK